MASTISQSVEVDSIERAGMDHPTVQPEVPLGSYANVLFNYRPTPLNNNMSIGDNGPVFIKDNPLRKHTTLQDINAGKPVNWQRVTYM